MGSTPVKKKYRKRNWKFVRLQKRDFLLFETTHVQRFLRRDHAFKHIFEGKNDYAIRRIWKLKTFGYLKAIKMKEGHPESYVLGQKGVEALREKCAKRIGGLWIPDERVFIDPAAYEHDSAVTEARFFLKGIGFKDWISERELKASTRGRKVPDGFVTCALGGVAVEVEINRKKAERYRKIFTAYFNDHAIQYVLYFCKNPSLMRFILKCAREVEKNWLNWQENPSRRRYPKAVMCVLLQEMRDHGEKALIHTNRGNLSFREALES